MAPEHATYAWDGTVARPLRTKDSALYGQGSRAANSLLVPSRRRCRKPISSALASDRNVTTELLDIAAPGSTSRLSAGKVCLRGAGLLLVILEGLLALDLAWELGAQATGVQLPRGGHYDFLAFYSAAHFASLGQVAQVYNASIVASFQHIIVSHSVGAAGYRPFLNPPFAAVFQAPLALFSEPIARFVWFGINSLLALVIVGWLTTSLSGKTRVLAGAAVLGTLPIYKTLIEGQWSLVMLLGCVAALHFARRGWSVPSGACLSVLWLKPQLAVIVLLGLLVFHCRSILLAMMATLVFVVLLTLPLTGLHAYPVYASFLLNVFGDHFNGAGALHPTTWQGKLSVTEGLNGLFVGWLGQSSVVAVGLLFLVSIGGTILLYQRAVLKVRPGFHHISNEMMLAASIALVLLIDPHLYPQDITLLFLAIPILSPHVKRPLTMIGALCLLTDAPLLDQVLPLHIFTVVLWCFTVLVCLAALEGPLQLQALQPASATSMNRAEDSRPLATTWLARVFGLA